MNHKMLKLLTGFSALAVAGLLSLVPASVSRADEYEPEPTLTPTPTWAPPLPDGYESWREESTSVTVNITDNISDSSTSVDATLNWGLYDIVAFDSVSVDSVDFIIYDQQLQNISINATLNATNYWETSAHISLSFQYGDYIYSIDKWEDINWASDTTATISLSDTGFFSNYTYEPPTPNPSIEPSPFTSTFTTNRIKVIYNGSEEECEANITWTFCGVFNDITVAYAVPTFTIYPFSQTFEFFGYFGTGTDYFNTGSASGSVEFDFTYNSDEYHGSGDFIEISPTGYGYYYVYEDTTGDFYVAPSASPSVSPSEDPEIPASASPSTVPSEVPASPSGVPASPSGVPASASPSASVAPSAQPSASPSVVPSTTPSAAPSTEPSAAPSATPSVAPSASPSVVPSTTPSATPSTEPSNEPSATPSVEPSTTPSEEPSIPPEDDDDPAVKEFYENINNTVNEIENAIANVSTVINENGEEVIEPVVVEYKSNTAISARIIKAMTEAKNVTLLYTFEYDGIIFRAVITPEQAALIFNEKTKWYGPCYIAENFPTVPIGFVE